MNRIKTAFVAVTGRPSVGKSTLINTICEAKVSITSPVPQTTRNAVRGVYTDSRGQLVFTDTPGLHDSDKQFNRRLSEISLSAIKDADLILYVLDGSRSPKKEETDIAQLLKSVSVPVICCINKDDVLTDKERNIMSSFISNALGDIPVCYCCATEDRGIDELLIELFKAAPYGELMYPENVRTDQDINFRIAEIIREKAMNNTSEEVPHSITSEVEDLEYSESENKVRIRAFILVISESQKAMLIGKNGTMIRKIRIQSFKDIKKIFPGSVLELDIRVKVNRHWKQNFHEK